MHMETRINLIRFRGHQGEGRLPFRTLFKPVIGSYRYLTRSYS